MRVVFLLLLLLPFPLSVHAEDIARLIQEDFYCNRRYAPATSPSAGGLAAQSVNILFQVCLHPSWARLWSLPRPLLQGGQPPCRLPMKGGAPPAELPGGMLSRLAAPRARLAWRLGGFITNSRE